MRQGWELAEEKIKKIKDNICPRLKKVKIKDLFQKEKMKVNG